MFGTSRVFITESFMACRVYGFCVDVVNVDYCAKHPCSLCEKVGFSVCLFVCLYGFSASFVGAEKTWAHVLLSTQSLKSGF